MAKKPEETLAAEAGEEAAPAPDQPNVRVPNIEWDDSKMTTSFANVVNVSSTREEVTLFFGTNQTWNIASANQVKVQLSDRIILTPYAAKRLWLLMGGLLKEYESRHGALELEIRGTAGAD